MAAIEVKNPTERNKLIAAIALGVLALVALYFAFGRSLFASAKSPTTSASPTPRSNAVNAGNRGSQQMPSSDEQALTRETTLIDYRPGSDSAPDAGRNIFAFYEPPPPTPYSPTPLPTPKPATPPPPTPTPAFQATMLNPSNIYAGSKGFRLEVDGDRFTPDAHIYFSQTQMPTTFVSAQKLVTDISANLIAQEGGRQIIVQSPDGKQYSEQLILSVQAPPKPTVQYIGMIGRKRYNNDTAYFIETGKTTPFGARLNDIVGGRFRLINITASSVTFEDTNLGFKHQVQISAPTGSSFVPPATNYPTYPNYPTNNGAPYNPGNGQCPPGIPCNIQPNQTQPNQTQPDPRQQRRTEKPKKDDVDDNDDGDG